MRRRSRSEDLLPRLENAVEILLFGRPASLRGRLAEACSDQLLPLLADDFPGELPDVFKSIHAAMTAYDPPSPAIGRIEWAGHVMSGARARSVAKMVFKLYTGVVQEILLEDE